MPSASLLMFNMKQWRRIHRSFCGFRVSRDALWKPSSQSIYAIYLLGLHSDFIACISELLFPFSFLENMVSHLFRVFLFAFIRVAFRFRTLEAMQFACSAAAVSAFLKIFHFFSAYVSFYGSCIFQKTLYGPIDFNICTEYQ